MLVESDNMSQSESRSGHLPNHLSFDYHNNLTPSSESSPLTQPKLEPNPILANTDSTFSALAESGSALNTNLNLQSATAGNLAAGLPSAGMAAFHWPPYSANYDKVSLLVRY